jgi:hypothetical protein
LRIGKCGARYSGYVDIALAGDIPAEGDRADEVHADKIRAESASQSFRYLITEHGDLGREHPAIIRHARGRLTAHHADPVDVRAQSDLICVARFMIAGESPPAQSGGSVRVLLDPPRHSG